MIKIIIADDHQLVADGIKLMLEEADDMQFVAYAKNGKEAVAKANELLPDILLLDINMPEMDGTQACKIIQSETPSVKIIALSMLKEMSMIRLMIQNGASGYLLKNAGQEEVLEAVRKVHGGGKYYSEEVITALMAGVSKKEKTAVPIPKISRREKQVLQLIVEEYTTAEIAEKLFISFGTVETHRRNLLVKLNARNTAGLVRAALEFDLIE